MTPGHFQGQMKRLTAQFPQAYSQERVALIWREVQGFSDAWFTRIVDKFVGECRQAPLMAEFRNEISFERERNWSKQKEQHAQDARDFYLIAQDNDMRGSIVKTIIDRMQGNCPDETWNGFTAGLQKLVGK